MGELFNSPHEWTPLIAERLIDYIRIHVSQAGGLTPCRKIAAFGEQFRREDRMARPGRRLAHRPRGQRDAGPGLLQLRRIKNTPPFNARDPGSLQGLPEMKDGYLYANEKPGWGIEVDEKLAAKFPFGERDRRARAAQRRLGRNAQPRRDDHQAVALNESRGGSREIQVLGDPRAVPAERLVEQPDAALRFRQVVVAQR